MREIILLIAVLCATAGASHSVENSQSPNKDSLTESTTTSTSIPIKESEILSTSASISNAANVDSTTGSSTQDGPGITTIILSEEDVNPPASLHPIPQQPPRRRIITYDQRQEGQYNIRADLDNFMIVMIPQTPSLFSELFLTKALSHNLSKSREKTKSKNSYNMPNFLKFRENAGAKKHTPIAIMDGDINHSRRLPEFIEGRTPYHVDISANDDEHSRLHPDRQVDVLPPPYPLAYQHLKPYHLEAEPTVIQALPPSELHAAHVSDKFLETYNQLLTSGLKNGPAVSASASARQNNDESDLGYYRISRSIRNGNNALDSDTLNDLNSLSLQAPLSRRVELPVYRSEHSMGAAGLYPPIDIPKSFGYFKNNNDAIQRTAEFQDNADVRNQVLDENSSSIGRFIVPTFDITVPQDDVELELHGVSLIDRAAKILLSDGLERCAPGHRRDSYGLCREIQGY